MSTDETMMTTTELQDEASHEHTGITMKSTTISRLEPADNSLTQRPNACLPRSASTPILQRRNIFNYILFLQWSWLQGGIRFF